MNLNGYRDKKQDEAKEAKGMRREAKYDAHKNKTQT
jgi:hypothetical protein